MTTTPTATNALAVDALPELPQPMGHGIVRHVQASPSNDDTITLLVPAFTADQMRDYARSAIATITAPGIAPAVGAETKRDPAPPSSLPGWGECAMRVVNSDFIAKRVAEGGYGAEADSKLATQLHRFIHEYDDADPYASGWFRHRLELLLNEVRSEAATPPAAEAEQPVDARLEPRAALKEDGSAKRWFINPENGHIVETQRGNWVRYVDHCAALASRTPPPAQPVAQSMFDALKHGDQRHQDWLFAAITAHLAGQPVPPVVPAPPAEALGDRSMQDTLDALRKALTGFHLALDCRENGHIAADKTINEFERVLGMPWRQGEALAALAARPPATHGVGDATVRPRAEPDRKATQADIDGDGSDNYGDGEG